MLHQSQPIGASHGEGLGCDEKQFFTVGLGTSSYPSKEADREVWADHKSLLCPQSLQEKNECMKECMNE